MSMNTLANCPKCGKVFVKGIRSICPECYQVVEEEYRRVYEFLRKQENRKSTITETSAATNVSIRQIREFIREGKLTLVDYPNMAYPCDSCGKNYIVQGNICEECRTKFNKELRNSTGFEQKTHNREGKNAGYLNRIE